MDCSDGSPKVPGAVWTNLTHQAFVVFPILCLCIGLRSEIRRPIIAEFPAENPPTAVGLPLLLCPCSRFGVF